jgi:hypothetical protein
MAKLKTYLMEQQMSEAELEDYLDYLYHEYMTQQEAYRYEDNPNPNDAPQPHHNTTTKGS